MHPAPSLIVFTVLSGAGFGLLGLLGLGLTAPTGWTAFWHFALGYALAGGGLVASAFHLGHPERALLAFTQWRSSWLSREAVLSVAALVVMAPHAAASVFWSTTLPWVGWIATLLCLATVAATAMIYAQLRTVPRWHHWSTPVVFVTASLAGGTLLAGRSWLALAALALLGSALVAHWYCGDRRFRQSAVTMQSATGLGAGGATRQLEGPHTGANYLTREMIHVVGRRHAAKLRAIGLLCAVVVPALLVALLPPTVATWAAAAVVHLAGMSATRWLFYAEAEHVVGLYYGRR